MMKVDDLLLSDALRLFGEWLCATNYSDSTLVNYTRDIQHLIDFLLDKRLVEVDKVDLLHAQADLCGHLSPRSRKRYVTAWRSFFRFCSAELDLPKNPAAMMRVPRVPMPPHIYLSTGDVIRLLETFDLGTVQGIRDHAVIVTLVNTGLRIGELRALTLCDLDLNEGLLRVVKSKNGTGCMVPLNTNAVKALQRWLAVRPDAGCDSLFVRVDGRYPARGPIARSLVNRMVQQHLERAGIMRRGLSTHKLRHTFAMMLLEARDENGQRKVSDFELQELMRHKSPATTRLYTQVNLQRLKAAVEGLPDCQSEQLQIFSLESVFSG